MMLKSEPLLRINGLKVFHESLDSEEMTSILNGITFELHRKIKTAVIGECGSGKSTLSLAICRKLPEGWLTHGEIIYKRKNLMRLKREEIQALCGKDIVLIPQIPRLCLAPNIRVGVQMSEAIQKYEEIAIKQVKDRAIELLERVGGPNPYELVKKYPGELSGVICQRIILAMGLVGGRPDLFIADEPTRGLNINERDDYLGMINNEFLNSANLIITHDLDVVKVCDEVIVMCAGEIIEAGPRDQVLENPRHPYTKQMLHAYPEKGMMSIPGILTALTRPVKGCCFNPRCNLRQDECLNNHPELIDLNGVKIRCLLFGKGVEA